MPNLSRPTIPPWPGHGCSRGFFEAPYRGAIVEFDQKLRRAERDTKAALASAVAKRDKAAVKKLARDLQLIMDDVLPHGSPAIPRGKSGAPLVGPGGRTRPASIMTPIRKI